MTFFLAFYRASILKYFLTYMLLSVEVRQCPLRSGARD